MTKLMQSQLENMMKSEVMKKNNNLQVQKCKTQHKTTSVAGSVTYSHLILEPVYNNNWCQWQKTHRITQS